ncbi:MAG: hypothetical protein CSA20_01635 [Deltaproteobacteria bacterium]|nr:MAG: hypothetical protein CSA20_01635 [Deltaproteobacteria bacterium]
MKKLIFLLLASICLPACLSHYTSPKQHYDKKASIPYGIFKGTLPCADCPGIETTLNLKPDSTFVYETNAINEPDGHIIYNGTYTVQENIVTIEYDTQSLFFLLDNCTLFMLDDNRKPITGELAPYYQLKHQRPFAYSGTYATFSASQEACQQTLSISRQGKDYLVVFSASRGNGSENGHFSGTGSLTNGTLFVDIDIDNGNEIRMAIRPSHDNLGVDVVTVNCEKPFQLMPSCQGSGSLAGTYLKNTLSKQHIGIFTASTTIEDILTTLPATQVHRTIGHGEFADDTYDDYEIYTRNNEHLLTLTPRERSQKDQKIHRVLITSPFFTTSKGIHAGSTYKEIREAYTITRIEPTRDHIVLIVDELHAHISIPKTSLHKDWWNPATQSVNPASIPDNARLDHFIVWWNE